MVGGHLLRNMKANKIDSIMFYKYIGPDFPQDLQCPLCDYAGERYQALN